MSKNPIQHRIISRVFEFNRVVVGIPPAPRPRALNPAETHWLRSALVEEADELSDAHLLFNDQYGDRLVAQVDACVDSIIFAIGGLCRLGLSEGQALAAINAVMDCNFSKVPGSVKQRSGAKDAAKPEGWMGPEARIGEIING